MDRHAPEDELLNSERRSRQRFLKKFNLKASEFAEIPVLRVGDQIDL